ncbi:MFS transporter [Nocardia sp. NPDC051030]|uniref:MFS transporter n=1 Tax=Nocardia sp. NPDC051030 TaxID=3155162 RepID=UPI00342EF666
MTTTEARTTGSRVLVVLCMAMFMASVEMTIVNVALPTVQRELNFSGAGLAWVVDAYSLTYGSLLLLGGRAADLFGRRRLFVAGFVIIAIGSLIGGMADTPGWLLAGRCLQGVGAAAATPSSLSLITNTFPAGPARQRAMAIYASMSGIGAAGGMVAGGLLTQLASWRWVLLINVPLCVGIVLAALVTLPESRGARRRLDVPGAVIGTAALSCLVYGAIHAGSAGWDNRLSVSMLAAAIVLFVLFATIEATTAVPMLPLRLLRDRVRTGALVTAALTYACLFPVFFFGTRYAQDIFGYSPMRTGLSFLPMTVAIVVSAGLVKAKSGKVGPRVFTTAGAILAALGAFWLSRLGVSSSYATGLLPGLLALGGGIGVMLSANTLLVVGNVAEEDTGIASGMSASALQTGGTLGLAAIASIGSTVTADSITSWTATHPTEPPTEALHQALASGSSAALLVASALAVLAAAVTLVTTPRRP